MKAIIPILLLAGAGLMVFINSKNLPAVTNNKSYDALFSKYGAIYGISPGILKSIATVESSLNPNAKATTSSALGLMQVTKAAAQDMGESYENQIDPETSIRTGAKYLRWLLNNYAKGNVQEAIRMYYAGAGTIQKGNANPSALTGWQVSAYSYSDTYLQKVLSTQTAYALV